MDKKEFASLITEFLKQHGFTKHKRKKNLWLKEEEQLTKYVKLNHSSFGNYYHLEYAFDLQGLEKDGLDFHIWDQVNLHHYKRTPKAVEELEASPSVNEPNNTLVKLFTDDVITEIEKLKSGAYTEDEWIQRSLEKDPPYVNAFDLDVPLDEGMRIEFVKGVIENAVLAKLGRIQTLEDVKQLLQTEDERYFVTDDVRSFLGLTL